MQQPTHTLSLETILAFTREKMQQLLHTLENEKSILEKNDIDELEKITLEKLTLTEQVEKNEKQRINFLSEKMLDPTEPSQWLSNNKLILTWQEIKKISEQCQKLNLVNGLVINGNRRKVQTQLEILNSAPATELVYSSSGESVNQGNSTTLARA